MNQIAARPHESTDDGASLPRHRRATARRFRLVGPLAIAILVVTTTACGDDATTDGATPPSTAPSTSMVDLSDVDWVDRTDETEITVQSRDNTFTPGYVVVKAGTPITFRNVGRTQHNALPVDEVAFEGIEAAEFDPQDEHTITFDEPGDYPYYCSLHGTTTRGMVGAIRVVE